jgi:SAM-dependent methyltransferase
LSAGRGFGGQVLSTPVFLPITMKTRESGMPDEAIWTGFFSPEQTLRALRLSADVGDVVDFGCGYGTFTIPAARMTSGTVYAIDIEQEMVDVTRAKAAAQQIQNVIPIVRDFAAEGTGLPDSSVGYVMLFNILHCERPDVLLREARRILVEDGLLGIMHWNHDATTPRGPSMSIRPRPEQCREWAINESFQPLGETIDLPPYHYGLVFRRNEN